MAESTGSKGKAFFRVVIAGSQEAIFRELTATGRPLGAIFDARMHATGLHPGGRLQMRTVDDMPLGTKTARQMQRRGGFILANLKSIVETGRPPWGVRLMYAAFGAREFVLPGRTRTELWPPETTRKDTP